MKDLKELRERGAELCDKLIEHINDKEKYDADWKELQQIISQIEQSRK